MILISKSINICNQVNSSTLHAPRIKQPRCNLCKISQISEKSPLSWATKLKTSLATWLGNHGRLPKQTRNHLAWIEIGWIDSTYPLRKVRTTRLWSKMTSLKMTKDWAWQEHPRQKLWKIKKQSLFTKYKRMIRSARRLKSSNQQPTPIARTAWK